jgi:hypothetical protein
MPGLLILKEPANTHTYGTAEGLLERIRCAAEQETDWRPTSQLVGSDFTMASNYDE